jgi:hypothetical protein
MPSETTIQPRPGDTLVPHPEQQEETAGMPHTSAAPQIPLFVVTPSRGWVSLQSRSLWEYRELLYFLVWRDVKVRYKQTALGVMWAVLQPFMTMAVFSIFFGQRLCCTNQLANKLFPSLAIVTPPTDNPGASPAGSCDSMLWRAGTVR